MDMDEEGLLKISFKPNKLVMSKRLKASIGRRRKLVDSSVDNLLNMKLIYNGDDNSEDAYQKLKFTYTIENVDGDDTLKVRIKFSNPTMISMSQIPDRLNV